MYAVLVAAVGLADPSLACLQVTAREGPKAWTGSGTVLVVAGRPVVLTCRHVCPDPRAAYGVRLKDGRALPARFVAFDDGSDLAVIQVDAPPATAGVGARLPPDGTPAWQWGYPRGVRTPKAGRTRGYGGTVARPDRLAFTPWFRSYVVGIQSDHGDSGAGVFAEDGTLFAVVWGRQTADTGTEETVGLPDVIRFLGVVGKLLEGQPKTPCPPGGPCPVQPRPQAPAQPSPKPAAPEVVPVPVPMPQVRIVPVPVPVPVPGPKELVPVPYPILITVPAAPEPVPPSPPADPAPPAAAPGQSPAESADAPPVAVAAGPAPTAASPGLVVGLIALAALAWAFLWKR